VIPLTWQDQSVLDLEGTADPWNIQLELSTGAPVDLDRLQDAIERSCRRHPMMRARLQRGGPLAARSHWVPTPETSVRVVETDLRDAADPDAALAELRTELYSPAFDLEHDDPLRVRVVRRSGAPDLVFLAVAHPVVDGIGLLRFWRSVSAAYRGAVDPEDPVPLERARDLDRILVPGSVQEVVRRAGEGGAKLAGAARPPSRVSRDSEDPRRGSGFAHRTLEPGLAVRVKETVPQGCTLNDLLLATTMHAVVAWNAEHGDEADKVQLFVPVNLRPAAWATEMVTNVFSYVSISTRRDQRGDLVATTRAVGRRTSARRRTGPARGTQDLLRAVAPVPLAVKALMPHLLTLTGHRFVDTAVVSNLGRPADLLSLDGEEPAEVGFTPPYWSRASVSVGAITTAGRLHVGVRHRLRDLDGPAGERFADLLVETLTGALDGAPQS